MDIDILRSLVFVISILIIVAVTTKRKKYKMTVRRWFGAIITIMASSELILGFSDLPEFVAIIFWLIVGLSLWLIKPKKIAIKR